jgi:hypothetical protein
MMARRGWFFPTPPFDKLPLGETAGAFSFPPESTQSQNAMLLKIACNSCGHTGIVKSESLPRDLVCSHCGASRRVGAKDGAPIRSREAVLEWLLGSKETRLRCRALTTRE